MKLVKRIVLWTIIAAIIEIVSFRYIDKYYLITDTNFKAIKVETVVENIVEKAEIKFPDDINLEVKLSFNGKYAAYKDGESIKLFNTLNGEIDELKVENGDTFSFFTWVPESNRILVVKKHKAQGKFKMYRYDAKLKDKLEEVKNYMDGSMDGQEVAIPIKADNAEVIDIDMSTYNGVMYVKTLNNSRRDEVYRMDRMAYMDRMNPKVLKTNMMGEINSTKHDEKLVYEDLVYGNVYATDVKNSLSPKDIEKTVLLGIDSGDDTVYIGSLENDKVTKIFFGSTNEPLEKWQTIELPEPLRRDQIYVAANSKLYVNYALEGFVKEIKSGAVTNYLGRFLQIYEQGVMSISQGNLKNELFKK
jgi:hypothetical protein